MAMTSSELRSIVHYLYGHERGIQRELAADLGVKEVTVSRWMTGYCPIGPVEERFIRLLVILYKKQIYYRALLTADREAGEARQAFEDLL